MRPRVAVSGPVVPPLLPDSVPDQLTARCVYAVLVGRFWVSLCASGDRLGSRKYPGVERSSTEWLKERTGPVPIEVVDLRARADRGQPRQRRRLRHRLQNISGPHKCVEIWDHI